MECFKSFQNSLSKFFFFNFELSSTLLNLTSALKSSKKYGSLDEIIFLKIYFLKSFLSFSMYYVSLEFVSGLVDASFSFWIGSYTTWMWLGCAFPAIAVLCWCAQLSEVTLRDLMSGGVLLLIDDENAKPRRRVALLVNERE